MIGVPLKNMFRKFQYFHCSTVISDTVYDMSLLHVVCTNAPFCLSYIRTMLKHCVLLVIGQEV